MDFRPQKKKKKILIR